MLTKRKPEWLKIKLELKDHFFEVKQTLKESSLVTVCEESHCPNLSECWSGGTATFMVLGDTCTRGCKFCNVKTNFPGALVDNDEPQKLVNAVKKWKLDYIVVTSVDRDDLPDQGAGHFAECIKKLKETGILVEVLIPDFKRDLDCIKTVVEAGPDVIAHNVETVERLQSKVRDPRANYKQSLSVLENVKKLNPKIYTKSSIIVGFGETKEEIENTMKDLRKIDVDVVTLGQYLRPSEKHIEVNEYVKPETFEYYEKLALELGFKYVAAGPFVRSSYKAGELFIKNILRGKDGRT
jgi:lipoyl synthase